VLSLVARAATDTLKDDCVGGDASSCERGCTAGDSTACTLLGNMYLTGVGVEKDEARAAHFFLQACKGTDVDGCRRLGDAYANGVGVARNETRAAELYRLACDAAITGGCIALKELCEHAELGGATPCSPAPATPPSGGDYDRPPRPIKIVKPKYPKEAFAKKIEGTVEVEILIDASGRVTRARIVKSVPALDQAALEAVYQWTFSPATKNGRPVATIARAPVMFRIYAHPARAPRP